MDLSQKPLVSICIPVFNGENFIKDCLDSVISQSNKNFEIIVIDNNSVDNTLQIVKSYNDPRIKIYSNEKNIGALNNFTKCIELASAEYFVMIPHDDVMQQNFIDEMSTILNKNKEVGIVYAGVNYIDEDKNIIKKIINYDCDMNFKKNETIKDIVQNFMPIQLPMVRTNILKKIGKFDENFSLFADVNLWMKIMYLDWNVYFISKTLSCLRTHKKQAQRAFQIQDTTLMSEHYGAQLNQSFWKLHNYNYLFLRLINFIIRESKKKKYNIIFIEKKLLPEICRLNIRAILLSILKFNKFNFGIELINFKDIYSSFGFKKMFLTFLFVISREIKNKFSFSFLKKNINN
jgi:glycosyltransferase involved in cell wall biosynthesis